MKKLVLRLGISLLAAGALIALAASGLLYGADSAVSDALYQRRRADSGVVSIVGIDRRSLDDIGPLPWDRGVMAQVIETLNADPESRPAVIGIDVLYIGDTDPQTDQWLARAAGECGNVVVACYATIGPQLVTDGDRFYMDESAVLDFEQPYDALRDVTAQGHINTHIDHDGMLRHAMLYIDLPDGRRIPSWGSVIYERYARYAGLDAAVAPFSGSQFFYVPFSGRPGDYSSGLSVSDLLAGDYDPALFAGKIVLIGPYAAGMQDDFPTAIDHASKMFGVEFQANIIDSFIRGDFKREAGDAPQLAALFVISALCLLWFWDRHVLPATITWLLAAGGSIGASALLYAAGVVTHVLWVPVAVTVLYIVTVAVNYIRAAVDKARVTSTFKRYVAPEIVTEILREDSDSLGLSGKLTCIAVLFVDVRGFTSMSERLPPQQVVDILNRYLSLMSECIMRNGGTLDKFIGDAAMAFWGAPLPQQDYVYNAVKTALDMAIGAKELNAGLERSFGHKVSFGIGVHCGDAVVGNIGADMRMDYTAIGDTVNTASRLESSAGAGEVLISRAVVDALDNRIVAESIGSITLKGKAGEFETFRLLGLSD